MPTPCELLPLIPLGLLAGLLSGLLGIGGGLVFSPLLLLLGLDPHQALATSTLAIVPTTAGGLWAHLGNHSLQRREAVPIALGAGLGAAGSSHLGFSLGGWILLGLQAGLYAVLAVVIRPRAAAETADEAGGGSLLAITAVGLVAGFSGGMLGVGGGLVMVPLMVQGLRLPVRRAVRLSTLAVLTSAATASFTFVADGRGIWPIGIALGGTAALAARWAAARLEQVSEQRLVWCLRSLTAVLAIDSGRRALALVPALGG